MEKEEKINHNNNAADQKDPIKSLPTTQWMLDPVLYASVKLPIYALLQAPQYYDFKSK